MDCRSAPLHLPKPPAVINQHLEIRLAKLALLGHGSERSFELGPILSPEPRSTLGPEIRRARIAGPVAEPAVRHPGEQIEIRARHFVVCNTEAGVVDVAPVAPEATNALYAITACVQDGAGRHCGVYFFECVFQDLEVEFLAAGFIFVGRAECVFIGKGFAWGHVPAKISRGPNSLEEDGEMGPYQAL